MALDGGFTRALVTFSSRAYQQAVARHVGGKYGG